MKIHKAIKISANDMAAHVNPKAAISMRQIAELQRRGDYNAKQDQLADNAAFHLTAAETAAVIAFAEAVGA